MERLDDLLVKTTQLYRGASNIVDFAIHDAVNLPKTNRPFLLSDEGLAGLTRHRNALLELVTYYTNQKEQFAATLSAIAARTGFVQEEAPQELPSTEESQQVETAESLRERIEKLAGNQLAIGQFAPEMPPVIHRGNRPDHSGVLEATEKLVSENLGGARDRNAEALATASAEAAAANDIAEPVVTPGGLPAAMPVVELEPENAAALRPQENSIMRLLSANSPLLDIFMMSPWLPNGQGYVTVGTPGFKWYKGTNPMEKDLATRAALPTGFYSGETVPGSVVLRMEKCILIWNSFQLDPSYMSVYMVGLSDADPNNIRWFKPSELAASHARQLITELLAAVEKYKTVPW